jgi:hypothetical protein
VPTHSEDPRFARDFAKLGAARQARFRTVLTQFVEDLQKRRFRPGLRVKRVSAHPGIWEMSWGPDDRATFQFGQEIREGDPHIVWRRIGSHDIFRQP